MLKCHKCGLNKPDEEFPRNSRAINRRGRFHNCRDCASQYYFDNQERQQLSNRRAHIKRRYGLTIEEYEALVADGCSICGETEKRIVMDHCHVSGANRAPLCDACNIMLGGARDDVDILRQAIRYLTEHASSKSPSLSDAVAGDPQGR